MQLKVVFLTTYDPCIYGVFKDPTWDPMVNAATNFDLGVINYKISSSTTPEETIFLPYSFNETDCNPVIEYTLTDAIG